MISRTTELFWKLFFAAIICLCLCELLFEIPTLKSTLISRYEISRSEDYDPSLSRLNSFKALEQYADSIYQATVTDKSDQSAYPKLVNDIVRKRFYHGYSTYSIGNNFLASFAGKLTGKSLDAIVKADDILEFSYADCRQQSIVLIELLHKKGYDFRSVSFKAEGYGEHFAFETYYDGSWHFYDPDMEPTVDYLNNAGRPGIKEIASQDKLLLAAYPKHAPELVTNLYKSYSYGQTNSLVHSKMYIFHEATGLLSMAAWLFLLIPYLIIGMKYRFGPTFVFRDNLHFPNWRAAL